MNNNDLLHELYHSVADGDIKNVENILAQDNASNIINALYDGSVFEHGSALHKAISLRDINMATLLLNNGANVNIQDKYGKTPLHSAILFNSHIDMLRLLLNNGADVNLPDMHDTSPLHYIIKVSRCSINRIQPLLDNGGNINLQDGNGETILHTSASYNRRDIVEFLLNNNADVNIKNKSGKTPVHLAAQSSNQCILQLLLDRYPDMVNLQDHNDKTALHLVVKSYLEILSAGPYILEFRENDRNKRLIDTLDVLDTLLNMGSDLNIKDNDGQTALHLAVLGYSTLNEAYYLRNADDNLDISCRSIDLIKSLCKNNNVNFILKNNDGYTVLDLALAIEHDQHKIAEHLQEKRLLWREEQIKIANNSLVIIAENKEPILKLKPDLEKTDADKFLEKWRELARLGMAERILDALDDDDFGTFQQLNEERKVALGEDSIHEMI
ncbi:ankyrin repeat-containing protein 16 [Orientia tsutsugamushi]|uniref:Ankyrin repeat-containing protein 16 n=1 Tax=Orientia tsutsugamushi TaxID=784 RepID=A0A2R8EZD9_ORITS|nr:ankyrin repeat domain-containing protein [Orientia tsutsugamushi]SPM44542.1 ankyrin repeat-containing protein 16 [Orientia tsutsugamushi]SPM44974.1 ankyrin repeat-containing protein 16 [Orientia tsutsugamushi]